MSRLITFSLCLLLSIPILLAGYQKTSPTQVSPAAKAAADYDSAAKAMAQSVRYVGQPLKNLTSEQKAAVAALLVMSRIVGQNEGARSTSALSLSNSFWTEVSGICPAPKPTHFKRGGCLDEESAYASAVARCMADTKVKKTQNQCEQESAGELGASVQCQMKQIENLHGIIGLIPGRKWPPGPFPWPEANPLPIR